MYKLFSSYQQNQYNDIFILPCHFDIVILIIYLAMFWDDVDLENEIVNGAKILECNLNESEGAFELLLNDENLLTEYMNNNKQITNYLCKTVNLQKCIDILIGNVDEEYYLKFAKIIYEILTSTKSVINEYIHKKCELYEKIFNFFLNDEKVYSYEKTFVCKYLQNCSYSKESSKYLFDDIKFSNVLIKLLNDHIYLNVMEVYICDGLGFQKTVILFKLNLFSLTW
ncbi:hypothetical protein A3Q56_05552 [Intoshia linei]|uniref:Uncharacterized protein n=1 Tax=Intoshia linei TaxID=1819745 RepID=A0A177AXL7_9BILA|nr:hypothetical protein A3Q56_05552 [Intoshia linei]